MVPDDVVAEFGEALDAEAEAWVKAMREQLAEKPETEAPTTFELPTSGLALAQLIERLRLLGPPTSPMAKDVVAELRKLLARFPDLRRHVPGKDLAWLGITSFGSVEG